MKKPTDYQNFINKPEVSFWTPIIFSAVSITISFMALSAKVDLLTERVDQLLDNQTNIISKYENVQERLGTTENEIVALQVRLNIK